MHRTLVFILTMFAIIIGSTRPGGGSIGARMGGRRGARLVAHVNRRARRDGGVSCGTDGPYGGEQIGICDPGVDETMTRPGWNG